MEHLATGGYYHKTPMKCTGKDTQQLRVLPPSLYHNPMFNLLRLHYIHHGISHHLTPSPPLDSRPLPLDRPCWDDTL